MWVSQTGVGTATTRRDKAFLTTRHMTRSSHRFKNNLDSYQVDQVGAAADVLDIEELVELGKTKQVLHGWCCSTVSLSVRGGGDALGRAPL